MARTFNTLEYQPVPGVAGSEQSFGDWGFEAISSDRKSQSESTTVLRMGLKNPASPVFPSFVTWPTPNGEVIPYNGWVVIRVNRIRAGSPGSYTYTGGKTVLQGPCTYCEFDSRGSSAGQLYTFSDPWYYLKILCYQQPRTSWAGGFDSSGKPKTTTLYTSDLFLFQGPGNGQTLVLWNTGQQIADIINYAVLQHVPIQRGMIEPAVQVQIFQCKDIMCSEALQNCLKSAPDAVFYFDHSSFPPILNCRYQANMTAVSLPYGAQTSEPYHVSTRIKSRSDLQVPGVALHYRITSASGNAAYLAFVDDIYPTSITGREPGVLVQTIDLGGPTTTNITGQLSVIVPGANVIGVGGQPADGNPSTLSAWVLGQTNIQRVQFWQLKQPQFKNFYNPDGSLNPSPGVKYGLLSVGQAWIEDDNGVDITASILADPRFANGINILDPSGGSIASWMQLQDQTPVFGMKVTLKATCGYNEYDSQGSTEGNLVQTVPAPINGDVKRGHEISCNVIITNGVSGNYATVGSVTGAEPQPQNLARTLYNSLKTLQYDGDHVIKETDCTHIIDVGNVLNIVGGLSQWATARMLVQSVFFDYRNGVTRVTVGPAKHLTAGDLISLFLFNRYTWNWRNPVERQTAQSQGGSGGSIGNESAVENTVHSLKETELFQLYYKLVASGKALPSIQLKPGDITTLAPELNVAVGTNPGPVIKAVRSLGCDNTGLPIAAVILSTDPFTPA